MEISLWRRHTLFGEDNAFSHKINYFTSLVEILNPKGHPNLITGAIVTAILLNEQILPIGAAFGVIMF